MKNTRYWIRIFRKCGDEDKIKRKVEEERIELDETECVPLFEAAEIVLMELKGIFDDIK